MAGIYIHIPFCRQKCHYCNFFSVASVKYRGPFFEALEEEIFQQREYLSRQQVGSVYLGGGTPSLGDGSAVTKILKDIRTHFPLARDAEITIEVNPDDVTPEILRIYKKAGINRISIGVQSFSGHDLAYLNRVHTGSQAMESIRAVMEEGFTNISIDLIYGMPTLTPDQWEQNLDTAFGLEIPHISAYMLTVEPKTGLDILINKHKLPAPDEEKAIEHFRVLVRKMRENGYEHYEISNFCRNGLYSVHNSNYWKDIHYLGLGPSAHSYNGTSRQWNVASVVQYIEMIRRKERLFGIEVLTPVQKYNEYVMVSLRTQWGCDLEKIRKDFGRDREDHCNIQSGRYLLSGELERRGDVLYLTDKGKIFADAIAAALFL